MADAQEIIDRLRNSTDGELATLRAAQKGGGHLLSGILIDQEIARRERLHQHELDLKLIADQVRWMKFTAIITAAATLIAAVVGAIAGAVLAYWLQPVLRQLQSVPPVSKSLQQNDSPTAPDRKEKSNQPHLSLPNPNQSVRVLDNSAARSGVNSPGFHQIWT